MPGVRMMLFGTLIALLLPACGTLGGYGGSSRSGHAEQDLEQAVKIYEDGDYATAIVILQHAQKNGLRSKYDQARAYKYLAFIHCTSAREKQCHDARE